MAQIYYVSMVDKKRPTVRFQITKAFPTLLGCKRTLNKLKEFYPSVLFQMEYVTCYSHEVSRFFKSYFQSYDFIKFLGYFMIDYSFDFRLEGSILSKVNV